MNTFDYIGEVLSGKRNLPPVTVGFSTTSIITLCSAIVVSAVIIILIQKSLK
ncbi:MAG: hypothetical protein ACOYOV_17890 [Bacteroidales bacterium]